MTKLTVVRERFGKPAVKAAELVLDGQVAVVSDTKFLLGLIGDVLSMPVKVKVRKGTMIKKRIPRSDSENLLVTLKANLYSPYRLMRDGEEVDSEKFAGRYNKVFRLTVLNGEDRHGLARKAS